MLRAVSVDFDRETEIRKGKRMRRRQKAYERDDWNENFQKDEKKGVKLIIKRAID